MQFIDEARIHIKAGNGGNGVISFRREKFVPKGGPDGGNGGRGGDVLVRADRHLNTLLDYKYRHEVKAKSGDNGRGKNQEGKSGIDEVLRVPRGTVVRNAKNGRVLADLISEGDEVVIGHGGKGGKGNSEFATATNQAPRYSEPGIIGDELDIVLELKLLADVGLVGFPNAGKSTLISAISAARPKIADYPFTTLVPNLGIVRYKEGQSFTVADIPGLIEGAHIGKGLGIQFLRHIERTRVLVFLIECTSEDPKKDFDTLMNELHSYKRNLTRRKKIVALTKIDIADAEMLKRIKKIKFGRGISAFPISAVAHEGLDPLLEMVWTTLNKPR
jgi:GTP-binding protein